ncbi:hypothetical protein [Pseudonocardia sp. T1-2H]|uniref:hypothetical protein n=1 Tax=Pseudonocardia sp. T1-2H TaxID=3128899 RepID=UPI003100C9F8
MLRTHAGRASTSPWSATSRSLTRRCRFLPIPGLDVAVYVEPGSSSADVLTLLASWTATLDSEYPAAQDDQRSH